LEGVRKKVDAAFDNGLYPMISSLGMLHACEMRRLSGVLATKTVGHLLPPELVEMVRDSIQGEEEVVNISAWAGGLDAGTLG